MFHSGQRDEHAAKQFVLNSSLAYPENRKPSAPCENRGFPPRLKLVGIRRTFCRASFTLPRPLRISCSASKLPRVNRDSTDSWRQASALWSSRHPRLLGDQPNVFFERLRQCFPQASEAMGASNPFFSPSKRVLRTKCSGILLVAPHHKARLVGCRFTCTKGASRGVAVVYRGSYLRRTYCGEFSLSVGYSPQFDPVSAKSGKRAHGAHSVELTSPPTSPKEYRKYRKH